MKIDTVPYELETELQHGRVHALVWCATGFGWEAHADAQLEPRLSVDALCSLLEALRREDVALLNAHLEAHTGATTRFKAEAETAKEQVAALEKEIAQLKEGGESDS